MPVLLDTTVLIDYLRGAPAADRVESLLLSGDVALTTPVNVEEVVRGLRPPEDRDAQNLFAGLVVVPLNAAEGWLAGVWRRGFAARGITLSQSDCLIASAARTSGATLATGNPKHFPMEGLRVEHWPVGA